MKKALLFGVVFASITLACSGSGDAPVNEENLNVEGVLPTDPTADGGVAANAEAGAKKTSPPKKDVTDAGVPAVADAAPEANPPPPPPPPPDVPQVDASGCTNETEPNDTSGSADALPSGVAAFCGTVSSTSDEDYAVYVLPADATDLRIRFQRSTGVSATITVEGRTFRPGQDVAPLVPGGRYLIHVVSTRAQTTYRIDLDPNG
jgi:hypothetical protein